MSAADTMILIGWVLIAPHMPAGAGMGLAIGFWIFAAICKAGGA